MSERTARPPAPPYDGEGPFALWHFSEDPGLSRFAPRRTAAGGELDGPFVWAVDTRHAPLYWFPRDCPRGCAWAGPTTTDEDRERFFSATAATRLHVVESAWLARIRSCRLYGYALPVGPFTPHEVGGYWVATEPVEATERVEVGDLLDRHARAGFEVRVTPSIWPFWSRVAASTLEFSGCRLRNAPGGPDGA